MPGRRDGFNGNDFIDGVVMAVVCFGAGALAIIVVLLLRCGAR